MDQKLKAHFEKLIKESLILTKKSIENLEELTKPISPDDSIGRVSRMEAIGEKSVNEANLRKAQKKYEQLEKALQRVQTEEYGFCLRCEEEISKKRLEILPESQICMNCLNSKEPT